MRKIDETGGSMTAGLTDWWVVLLVVTAGIAASLQIGKAAIAIPLLQAETGRDLAVLGWVSSIFAVLGLFG
ncbi:MAG: MFS transporter, partial [Proteobacteria bacterium]|nr:MFS transporter [Pseudomonadota bacterium]